MDRNTERALRKAREKIEDALLHLHNAGIGGGNERTALDKLLIQAAQMIEIEEAVRS